MAMLTRTARSAVSHVARVARSAPGAAPAWARSHHCAAPVDEDLYSRQRSVFALGPRVPHISGDAWVAPSAHVIGDVDIVDGATVWYNAVVRGDLNNISIGPYTSVGDKSVVHASRSSPTGLSAATAIGGFVVVGPGSILRSTNVGDNVQMGPKCILMEGSVVEKNVVLEAGTVVPPGRLIPSGQVWGGNPAKYVRDLSADEIADLPAKARQIAATAFEHSSQFLPHPFSYVEAEKLRATAAQ